MEGERVALAWVEYEWMDGFLEEDAICIRVLWSRKSSLGIGHDCGVVQRNQASSERWRGWSVRGRQSAWPLARLLLPHH